MREEDFPYVCIRDGQWRGQRATVLAFYGSCRFVDVEFESGEKMKLSRGDIKRDPTGTLERKCKSRYSLERMEELYLRLFSMSPRYKPDVIRMFPSCGWTYKERRELVKGMIEKGLIKALKGTSFKSKGCLYTIGE